MVITISRTYATGGRTVAAGLAENLGLMYYDRDFMRMTAAQSGYSEEDGQRAGENMSSGAKWMNDFLDNMASYTSAYDRIYEAQRKLLLDLAKENCIIIGRCSNIILREAGVPTFDIFLYADREHQIKRAIELNEYGSMDPAKYVERRDHLREVYYKAYTNHEMGDYRDYNICLDTGTIGIDKTIELLTQILKEKMG